MGCSTVPQKIIRGERPIDVERQERLFIFGAKKLGHDGYGMAPSNSGKYRIDGWFTDINKDISAWVEVKWYPDGKRAFCGLNIPKYMEMYHLSMASGLPSLFVFHECGSIGLIEIHSGQWAENKPVYRLTGGTPSHRQANPDDIEPMAMLDKSSTVWLYRKKEN